MEVKDYLERSGLKELNTQGLDDVAMSRVIEQSFLEFIDTLSNADGRWKSIAKTHIEQGGMAIRKAISLPLANQVQG